MTKEQKEMQKYKKNCFLHRPFYTTIHIAVSHMMFEMRSFLFLFSSSFPKLVRARRPHPELLSRRVNCSPAVGHDEGETCTTACKLVNLV